MRRTSKSVFFSLGAAVIVASAVTAAVRFVMVPRPATHLTAFAVGVPWSQAKLERLRRLRDDGQAAAGYFYLGGLEWRYLQSNDRRDLDAYHDAILPVYLQLRGAVADGRADLDDLCAYALALTERRFQRAVVETYGSYDYRLAAEGAHRRAEAAAAGHPLCLFEEALDRMVEAGQRPRDLAEAERLFRRAKAAGHPGAAAALAELKTALRYAVASIAPAAGGGEVCRRLNIRAANECRGVYVGNRDRGHRAAYEAVRACRARVRVALGGERANCGD